MTYLEYGFVHGCKGAAAGTRAGNPLTASAVLVENGALGDDDNVSTAQLFLQLAHQLALNFMVLLQLSEGHKQDDSFAASGDVDLFGSGDVEAPKLLLDLKSTNLV